MGATGNRLRGHKVKRMCKDDPSIPIRGYRLSKHDSEFSCEQNSAYQRNKGRPDDLPKVSGKDKQAAGARLQIHLS